MPKASQTSTVERQLPHNLEAERSLLGAALLHDADFTKILGLITAGEFFRDAHRRIFQSMVELRQASVTIDFVTVKNALQKKGDLDEVGGPAYITALVDGIPHGSNIEHYARILREKARARDAIYAANRVLSSAYEESDTLGADISKATGELLALSQPIQPGRPAFEALGEQRYALRLPHAGVSIEVDRLRRHSNELIGELSVTVNGQFPTARTVDGVVSVGDFNFSSVQARGTRAKILAERAPSRHVDWIGLLEEFAVKVVKAERAGKPAVALADIDDTQEDRGDTWDVSGFPILQTLPTVLFGDGSSGKSYFALWIIGQLAQQGVNVLLADWEFDGLEHKKRLRRLFDPAPRNVVYAKCDRSIREEADRLTRLVREHECGYICCDSLGFAVDGPAEAHEGAAAYFRYLRQFGVGSLNIAHTPKHVEDGKDASIFGSVFFRNGARSVWFIQRTFENPSGEIKVGLYHRKSNVGDLLAPRGFKFVFDRHRTRVESVSVASVDELAAGLPLLDRMKRILKRGSMSVRDIAEELNTSASAVRSMVSRHQSQFIRVGKKVGIKEEPLPGMDF